MLWALTQIRGGHTSCPVLGAPGLGVVSDRGRGLPPLKYFSACDRLPLCWLYRDVCSMFGAGTIRKNICV